MSLESHHRLVCYNEVGLGSLVRLKFIFQPRQPTCIRGIMLQPVCCPLVYVGEMRVPDLRGKTSQTWRSHPPAELGKCPPAGRIRRKVRSRGGGSEREIIFKWDSSPRPKNKVEGGLMGRSSQATRRKGTQFREKTKVISSY